MENIVLSICIPSYNRKESLLKQLLFLQEEKLRNVEIIVLDNCSQDGTFDSVNNTPLSIENFKFLVNDKNIGADGSIRKLLDLASGDYVLFLGDDIYEKGCLNKLIELLIKHKPSLLHVNNSETSSNIEFLQNASRDYISNLVANSLSSLMFMSCNIYKRRLLLDRKDFPRLNYSTTLLYSICCLCFGNIVFVNDNCVIQDCINVSWNDKKKEVWFKAIPQIFTYYENSDFGFNKRNIKKMKWKNYGFFLFCCIRRPLSTIKFLLKEHCFFKIVTPKSSFYFFYFFTKRLFGHQ